MNVLIHHVQIAPLWSFSSSSSWELHNTAPIYIPTFHSRLFIDELNVNLTLLTHLSNTAFKTITTLLSQQPDNNRVGLKLDTQFYSSVRDLPCLVWKQYLGVSTNRKLGLRGNGATILQLFSVTYQTECQHAIQMSASSWTVKIVAWKNVLQQRWTAYLRIQLKRTLSSKPSNSRFAPLRIIFLRQVWVDAGLELPLFNLLH